METEETVGIVGVRGEVTGLFEFGYYPGGGVRLVAVAGVEVEHDFAVVDCAGVVDFPEYYATVF